MNKEQEELLDEVYETYLKNWKPQPVIENELHWMEQELVNNRPLPKDMFIHCTKTDTEFSEKWGLKIEERELSLEERLEIADKFNTLIREDCLTKTHHPDETEEFKLIYRHAWLDSLGPNVVPERKLITITYNDKTIESYE
jgi:hypothetical protein